MANRSTTGVFSIAVAVACAGCVRVEPIATQAQPIIGGTTDTGDPGVVLIRASDNQGYSLCTGEIVSPHVVMTAAHCTDPAEVGSGVTFEVFIGSDMNGAEGQDPSKWLAVQATDYNQSFNSNNVTQGNDVGVVVLKSATTITPLAMNTTAMSQSLVGQTIRIVGFGNNNGTQGTGAGTKRQTTTPLSSFDSQFVNFGTSTHDTCQGDSGGPAFMTIGGVEVIVGVTSFGPSGCAGGATDTRVDTVAAPWIDQYIQKYDPANSAPPDMAQPPAPADMTQPPAPADLSDNNSGGNPNGNQGDLAVGGNNNNGNGNNQNGDGGPIHLSGNGSGEGSGRLVGGCAMGVGGRAALGGAIYFVLLTLVVLRRRGRARY
jgi:V8-like Glu-specific endopeptidase